MTTVSNSYDLVWRFKKHRNLQVDRQGNIINVKTGRKRRLSLNGNTIGLWLDSKTFVSKRNLNNYLEKIQKVVCPF